MTPEFSRPHRLDQIGIGESQVEVFAGPEERAALARRFSLPAIDRLEAVFTIRRDAAGVMARGHLSGEVTQSCVVTEEPIPTPVEQDFAIRFLPAADADSQEELELSEDECDTVFYEGGAIDLGEAAAETLALALDPFPRSPNAAKVLKEAGVLSEEEVEPLGALSGLKDLLGKK